MDIKKYGLEQIKEISSKFDILIDDNLIEKYPLIKFRIYNIFTYFNNILEECENISRDYNNNNNQEYIKRELEEMISIEDIINNYFDNI